MIVAWFCCAALGAAPASAAVPSPERRHASDTLFIADALLVDGSGRPARRASVRVAGGRILGVGRLRPGRGDTVVQARGRVLAPGFIDTHAHYDRGIFEAPDVVAATSQGITTVVVGQDGGEPYPLADFFARLEREPVALDVAAYAGHGTLRQLVMGDDFKRVATPREVDSMAALLRGELAAGALGLSTGLEYDPGIYSDPEEVLALAKVASAAHGRYISHVRSEDRHFWEAVEELIRIGREARLPVQLSHAKLAMRSIWGQADRLIARLDSARAQGIDVTADIYPYTYWQSTITVLFPGRDFDSRAEAELVLKEVAAPDGILLTDARDPTVVNKTVAQIARERGTDSVTTLLDLTHAAIAAEKEGGEDAGTSIIGTSMAEQDIERIFRWPHSNICSDGASSGGHPRGYGTFPRVLGRYVRERRTLTLEEAVRKMTSLAARHMGFTDRGLVAPGYRADLVLFDPNTVSDRSTPTNPTALSAGIVQVWVNGVTVYQDGKPTGAHPGRPVRRT
jgi:N-acyl-D-amino-acid deacylase